MNMFWMTGRLLHNLCEIWKLTFIYIAIYLMSYGDLLSLYVWNSCCVCLHVLCTHDLWRNRKCNWEESTRCKHFSDMFTFRWYLWVLLFDYAQAMQPGSPLHCTTLSFILKPVSLGKTQLLLTKYQCTWMQVLSEPITSFIC